MNDSKDKLIVIAYWAILKMGYFAVDEAGRVMILFFSKFYFYDVFK
jgi:hypothetical protein